MKWYKLSVGMLRMGTQSKFYTTSVYFIKFFGETGAFEILLNACGSL